MVARNDVSLAKVRAEAKPNRRLGGYDVTIRVPDEVEHQGSPARGGRKRVIPTTSREFYAKDWTAVLVGVTNLALQFGVRGISVSKVA